MSSPTFAYIQILTKAGFVHNVSLDTWTMLKEEIKTGVKHSEFEDIYGGEIEMDLANIDSTRRWSPEVGEKYRAFHEEHEDDPGTFDAS